MSDGVVILPSYYDAIKNLSDKKRLAMLEAIICYGLYGEIKELYPEELRMLFILIKPNIDASQNRHRARKENGRKPPKEGSRPRGRPKKNQTDNQSKNQTDNQTDNQTENQDSDLDSDFDFDNDSDKKNDADKPLSSSFKKYGVYGWVKLSDAQYTKLVADLGQSELDRCIQYVDEYAQLTGNKKGYKDWNIVIRRCSREGWGKKPATATDLEWRKNAVVAWRPPDD